MTLATESDAMREWVWNVGSERKDQAWLLTDYDVWVRNPHYVGPEVPHPEEYVEDNDICPWCGGEHNADGFCDYCDEERI